MGEILTAGEESNESPPSEGDLIAYCSSEYWMTLLQRIEDRALRDGSLDLEEHVTIDARQGAKMWWESDPDHVG